MNNLSGKKRKKFATAGALMLAAMLALSACGANSGTPTPSAGPDNDTGDEVGDLLPDSSGLIETGSAGSGDNEGEEGTADNGSSADAPSDNGVPADNDAILGGTGVYTGQIDSNSIEITTDGEGAAAYRITEELAPVIESLPSDARVKFEYTIEEVEGDDTVKQNWLKSIVEIED